MNWNQRYKDLKKSMKWTDKDVEQIGGWASGSIRNRTRKDSTFPRGLKVLIEEFEMKQLLIENFTKKLKNHISDIASQMKEVEKLLDDLNT